MDSKIKDLEMISNITERIEVELNQLKAWIKSQWELNADRDTSIIRIESYCSIDDLKQGNNSNYNNNSGGGENHNETETDWSQLEEPIDDNGHNNNEIPQDPLMIDIPIVQPKKITHNIHTFQVKKTAPPPPPKLKPISNLNRNTTVRTVIYDDDDIEIIKDTRSQEQEQQEQTPEDILLNSDFSFDIDTITMPFQHQQQQQQQSNNNHRQQQQLIQQNYQSNSNSGPSTSTFISRNKILGHQHLHQRIQFQPSPIKRSITSVAASAIKMKRIRSDSNRIQLPHLLVRPSTTTATTTGTTGVSTALDESLMTFECPICHMKFNKKLNLTMHQEIHSTIQNYRCDYCPRRFKTKHHQSTHIHTMHRTELTHLKYRCPCGKFFQKESSLENHRLEVHVGLQCKFCEKVFYSRPSLAGHIQSTHLICSVETCHQNFANRTALILHKKKFHPNRRVYNNFVFQAMVGHGSIAGLEFESSEKI